MNFEQAIQEILPYKDLDDSINNFINRINNLSKTPEPLIEREIQKLIHDMAELKFKHHIIVDGRSLAITGLRVICILTILKPVDPKNDFTISPRSQMLEAIKFLDRTDNKKLSPYFFYREEDFNPNTLVADPDNSPGLYFT